MPLTLISPAFADGERMPEKYTQDADNLSPPLRWAGVPPEARSLMLLVEDPDAPGGTFRHWAVYNIPPDRDGLPESVETGPNAVSLRFGRNDFGNARWDGPAPPPGHGPHRYRFRLAALDTAHLAVPSDAGAASLWNEARKHLVEEADLTAVYER